MIFVNNLLMLLILHEIRFIIIALLCGGFLTSFIPFIFAEPSIVDHSLKIELIAEGLSSPTSMAFVDSQNILVLEKNSGDVRLVSSGYLKEQPVLELDVDSTTLTCCRGLLGIAVNNLGYTGGNKQVFLYFTAAEAGKNDNPILNKRMIEVSSEL